MLRIFKYWNFSKNVKSTSISVAPTFHNNSYGIIRLANNISNILGRSLWPFQGQESQENTIRRRDFTLHKMQKLKTVINMTLIDPMVIRNDGRRKYFKKMSVNGRFLIISVPSNIRNRPRMINFRQWFGNYIRTIWNWVCTPRNPNDSVWYIQSRCCS